MNHNQALLSSLEALFTVTVKQADRHGLDEIRISKARAKELLNDIITARKQVKQSVPTSARDRHLDTIFGV
jgi:hypothetical protein